MAGTSRRTGPRLRARAARLAVIGVVVALATVFTPGTASAAGSVTPIVDCYRDNGDGTFWVVVGYKNTTGAPRTYAHGTSNQVWPARLQGQQPKQFATGTVHGAWRVQLTFSEIFYQDARWVLNGTTIRYSQQVQYATVCPPSTVLPADGNGLGTAIALGGAGAVGGFMLWRARRRLEGVADHPTTAAA